MGDGEYNGTAETALLYTVHSVTKQEKRKHGRKEGGMPLDVFRPLSSLTEVS